MRILDSAIRGRRGGRRGKGSGVRVVVAAAVGTIVDGGIFHIVFSSIIARVVIDISQFHAIGAGGISRGCGVDNDVAVVGKVRVRSNGGW